MSVRKAKRSSSKRSKNLHHQFQKAEAIIFRVVLLVVFLLHVCKFVFSEIQGFVK